ncbi:MAG TPA: hypothetical protein V6C58_06565 [Allocoleopsis sp.]
MAYGRVLKYVDENGISKEIFVKPISPFKFKELFRIAKKMQSDKSLEQLDDSVVQDMISLCVETIDRSCPDWTKEQKEDFITMHFTELMNVIGELNSPKQ